MKRKMFVVALISVFAVASAYTVLTTRSVADAGLAMVELQVSNMTCGSCVATITEALESVSGVESIDVSVTTGTSKISFDPQQVAAVKLAEVVTSVGFPAQVKQQLTSEQYKTLQTEETRLSADYVARIGEQLISRFQFDKEVERQLKIRGSQNQPQIQAQIIAQVWQEVKQRTLMLQAAAANQVVVHDGEVALRIEQLKKSLPNLDDYIQSRYGSMDRFRRQLKEEMVISRNIQQHVLDQPNEPRNQRQLYQQWFQGLVDNTAIKIYDRRLKQAASTAGGCGGCCG